MPTPVKLCSDWCLRQGSLGGVATIFDLPWIVWPYCSCLKVPHGRSFHCGLVVSISIHILLGYICYEYFILWIDLSNKLTVKYCTHFKDEKTEGQKYELLIISAGRKITVYSFTCVLLYIIVKRRLYGIHYMCECWKHRKLMVFYPDVTHRWI